WTRNGDRLRVENPSPFHVTLAEVHAVTGSSEKAVEDKGAMVAPKQSLEFAAPAGTDQVRFITINDYGGRVEHTIRLGSTGG
ncbi:hypothetical protein QCF01_16165, partial [Staphylococcus aureus]|nr:hypothetical protein [Staphylococcus aureus]